MPDVNDIYDSNVLTGVVNEMPMSDNYTWAGKLPVTPLSTASVATWEVERGSRTIAHPNSPGAEANIVGYQGRQYKSGSTIASREKKVIDQVVASWTRESASQAQRQKAEEFVARQLADLNLRVTNLYEWACWQAIQGKIVFSSPDVSVNVDMGFKDSHKVTAATPWASATAAQIRADIIALKELIRKDSFVPAKDVYAAPEVIDRIFTAFAETGQVSDRMKDAYWSEQSLPGFQGLNWHPVAQTYDVENTSSTAFYMPKDTIFIGNYTDNKPFEILEGTAGDFEIPETVTGRYSKSWTEHDPGQRVVLVGSNFLPVITRPDQMASLKIA